MHTTPLCHCTTPRAVINVWHWNWIENMLWLVDIIHVDVEIRDSLVISDFYFYRMDGSIFVDGFCEWIYSDMSNIWLECFANTFVKRENYQNCSVLRSVQQLCTVICTHTYEQFLKMSVGLGLVSMHLFRFSILYVFFWFSLDNFVLVLLAFLMLGLVSSG